MRFMFISSFSPSHWNSFRKSFTCCHFPSRSAISFAHTHAYTYTAPTQMENFFCAGIPFLSYSLFILVSFRQGKRTHTVASATVCYHCHVADRLAAPRVVHRAEPQRTVYLARYTPSDSIPFQTIGLLHDYYLDEKKEKKKCETSASLRYEQRTFSELSSIFIVFSFGWTRFLLVNYLLPMNCRESHQQIQFDAATYGVFAASLWFHFPFFFFFFVSFMGKCCAELLSRYQMPNDVELHPLVTSGLKVAVPLAARSQTTTCSFGFTFFWMVRIVAFAFAEKLHTFCTNSAIVVPIQRQRNFAYIHGS